MYLYPHALLKVSQACRRNLSFCQTTCLLAKVTDLPKTANIYTGTYAVPYMYLQAP